MKKILIVVDMQNDFITGPLGTPEARSIVPKVAAKVREYMDNGDYVIATMDTHDETYLTTLEGKKLPVEHCRYDTDGWKLCPELAMIPEKNMLMKFSFGTDKLPRWVDNIFWRELYTWHSNVPAGKLDGEIPITIVGVCTDICVVSNALMLRSVFPNALITVDASCCAGTTPEMHEKALDVMRSCQIDIK